MFRQRQYLGNAEPTTDELLSDPITHLLMARDGLHLDHVRAFINQAKNRLLGRTAGSVKAPDRADRLLS
jgi:hypothetical protein